VLSVDGNDAFVVADQILEYGKKYNESGVNVTWETCTLRSWLNNDFLNAAFTSAEQEAIYNTTVVNADNPSYGTSGGNNTTDKIYLLSIAEASNPDYGFNATFNRNDCRRKATRTAYTGATSGAHWWLRSPGGNSANAALVNGDGYGDDFGHSVRDAIVGPCPALHVNLSSSSVIYAGKVQCHGYSIEGQTAMSGDLNVEGFQIRINNPSEESVAYRTVCKAPNVGDTITAGGNSYTVASVGTIYTLDPTNKTGNHANDVLNASYTHLDSDPEHIVEGEEYTYEGLQTYNSKNQTYGYVATGNAILSGWNASDTEHTYYAMTMQGMDANMANTIFVRAFVKATDGTIIYSPKTAITSVARIANDLYTNNYVSNYAAHNYLYEAILHQSILSENNNIYYRDTPLEYGWNSNLYTQFIRSNANTASDYSLDY